MYIHNILESRRRALHLRSSQGAGINHLPRAMLQYTIICQNILYSYISLYLSTYTYIYIYIYIYTHTT